MLEQLENYRTELEGIISRFQDRPGGLYIDSSEADRLQVLVTELRDLFQDHIGPNNYSQMIVDAYNQGRQNYIQSPSLASVKQIKGVVEASITRARANPTVFEKKVDTQHSGDAGTEESALILPPQITLRWLYEHVPYRFWMWLGALLAAAFTAGGFFIAQFPFLQNLLGVTIGEGSG